ncbi:MAG: 1-acyl-sn-glycerol-3-phosphate acyltransferase [Burkholderiaceae bacterium]|nr:1-acyl-sn-glycerol-3-phosphate acyltransferase [Burkholderiaceae bacterium]
MLARSFRRLWRFPQMLALLAAGLFTVVVLFPFGSDRSRREAIRRWSAMLVAACGVRVIARTVDQARALRALAPGRMLVANHVSWLDIFVINAHSPCGFVAKAEIARWPLIGTLVARTGTLFIERGRRHAVHETIEHICRRLEAGGRVAVFPEGTTSDGCRLLPFHANLIEAAVRARAAVVPVGLRYLDGEGERASAIEYVGTTTLLASVWRITGERALSCAIDVLDEIPAGELCSRHDIAQGARIALAMRLELALDDALPQKLRELRNAN